jgi:hypothetical protein
MDRDHRVRPRWVWSGLLLALLGTCLLALWIATWRAGAGIGGAILLVLGGAAAMRGGILYDTHGARPVAGEIDEVRDADVHRGTAPGDMITDPHLRAEARETSRMTDQLLRAAQDAPWRPLDRLGGILLTTGAAFLVVIQGFYPHTHTGQDNATRSLLLAVVVALAALRILLGQRPGRAVSGLAGLVGVALVLLAVLTDHDRSATVVLEIVTGAWIVLASVLSLDHPRLRPQPTLGAVPAGTPSVGAAPGEGRPTVSVLAVGVVAVLTLLGVNVIARLVHAVRDTMLASGSPR